MVIMASSIACGHVRTTVTTELCKMVAILQLIGGQTRGLFLILDIHVMVN